MPKPIVVLFFSLAAIVVCAPAMAQVSIATVPVGNVGNPADPLNGDGSVNYAYSIGKYDVTVAQYTAFLNAVAATDPYSLYRSGMGSDQNVGNIARSGSPGSYTYSVVGNNGNEPITYTTWEDAARFANWMANGQPTGPEGSGTTETGSYTMNGATTDAQIALITRNSNATWALPTENEWYKAAFYQPTSAGGPASGYWTYPDRSNTVPTSQPPPGGANSANVETSPGGLYGAYALTGSTTLNPNQNYLTNVGAYTNAFSYYGTFDQSTLVGNWTESILDPSDGWRGDPGGAWNEPGRYSASDQQNDYRPAPSSASDTGIRLVLLVPTPEPSSITLVLVGCAALWALRKPFR